MIHTSLNTGSVKYKAYKLTIYEYVYYCALLLNNILNLYVFTVMYS